MHTAPGGLGAQLQARQGAAAAAHTKQWAGVGITDAADIIEYDNVFVGIFLQKHALKELPCSNGSKAGYNCRDVVGTDREVG